MTSFDLGSTVFDMENVLTRAVHRVLSGNNSYDYATNSVEKPKVHFQPNISQSQIRLVADQLCRRIERRYEKRLAEEITREKHQNERMLAQIRSEYKDELDQRRKELEHERTVMEEQLREKERTLQHKMDLREMDKEGALIVQWKLMENRYAELKLAIERIDKARTDFKKRVEADKETIRLEWERLSSKEAEINAQQVEIVETREYKDIQDRLSESEKENQKLKVKIVQLERENSNLNESKEKIEDEVRMSVFRVRDSRPSGDSSLIRELMAENDRLKEEVLKLQIRSGSDSSSQISRLKMEFEQKEETHLLKIREQKHIIGMMHDKLRHLTSDRNYLQRRVKDLQREQIYESRKENKATKTKKREKLPNWSEEEGSTSSTESTVSNGSMEIANIKKRISNLDQIAKQLDASVEMFSYVNKSNHVHYDEDDSYGYDDFCRSMIKNEAKHSSPIKYSPVKHQAEYLRRIERSPTVQNGSAEHGRRESPQSPQFAQDDTVTAKAEPIPARNGDVVRPTSLQLVKTSAELRKPATSMSREAVEKPVANDFAERLKQRNAQIARKLSFANEEEAPKEIVPATVAPQENPMQANKSTTLSDYMSMLSRSTEQPTSSTKPQIEPTFDEIHFDQGSNSDGEIDW